MDDNDGGMGGGGGSGGVAAGSEDVLGGLAHLPVAVGGGGAERGHHVVAVEGGEGQHGSSAHGGFVGTAVQHGGKAAFVAERPERSDARLAHEGIGRVDGQPDELLEHLVAHRLLFPARPGRCLHHGVVAIPEERPQRQPGSACRKYCGPPSDGWVRILEGPGEGGVVEGSGASERAQPEFTRDRVGVVQGGAGGGDVAGVAGRRDGTPAMATHWRNSSVSRMTAQAAL